MFEQTFVETRGRNPWAMALSFATDCLLVAALVLIPLVYTEALPRLMRSGDIFLPPAADPAPPARPQAPPRRAQAPGPTEFVRGRLQEPSRVPNTIPAVVDTEPPAAPPEMPGRPGVWGGSGEVRGGVQILDLIDTGKLLAPSPPPQPAPQPLRRIWVGGDLQQARAIYQPQPAYPRLALQAHITGVVRLAAVISARGTIEELRVIDGPALLIDAAVEAVRQWRYRPLVLNGVPYEVDTRIEVRFVLN